MKIYKTTVLEKMNEQYSKQLKSQIFTADSDEEANRVAEQMVKYYQLNWATQGEVWCMTEELITYIDAQEMLKIYATES